MTWSIRQLAAGAQTLRLFTALVCSVAVTSAVAGPMAWQALEYRRDEAALLAPAVEPSEASSAATTRSTTGGGAPGSGGATVTSPGPSTTVSASTVAGTGPVLAGQAGSSTTAGSGALGAEVTVPNGVSGVNGPVSAAGPPTTVGLLAEDPVQPGTTAPAPTTSVPTTGTTVTQPPTATTLDPLDEFNPRPPCDDAAHELRVDAVPCEPVRP